MTNGICARTFRGYEMMKKRLAILAAFAVILAGGVSVVVAQSFWGNALDICPAGEGQPNCIAPDDIWIRYYVAGASVGAGGDGGAATEANCTTTFVNDGGNDVYCAGNFIDKKGGFQGYTDDVFNYGQGSGARAYTTFDLQTGGGTASHVGYYAWGSGVITGDPSGWFNRDCTGTNANDCAGQTAATDGTGSDQADVPGGPITPIGGMRPIPVPRVTAVTPTTAPATIELTWDAVVANTDGDTGAATPATPGYIVRYAVNAQAAGACPSVSDVDLFNGGALAVTTGTSAVVDVATDLGVAVGSENCVTFGLQIQY
jgi:hypothetical protein